MSDKVAITPLRINFERRQLRDKERNRIILLICDVFYKISHMSPGRDLELGMDIETVHEGGSFSKESIQISMELYLF